MEEIKEEQKQLEDMSNEQEVLLKIKEFQKAQICFIALQAIVAALPLAYVNPNFDELKRNITIQSKFQDAKDRLLKIVNEIGKETLDKYLLDGNWCATHMFTSAEQKAATKEFFGEEWDLDRITECY